MQTLAETRRQMAAVDLVEGLPAEEALSRFGQGLRLGEAGQRVAAFYAADLFAQGAHEDWGQSKLLRLIEDRFDLDRRRTGELVRVGWRLRALPLIDQAFREDRLSWSKVLLLVRVASPEHEAVWLQLAQDVSYPKLQVEVQLAVPGGLPRQPGQRRGIHEIRKRHNYTVSKIDDEMIAAARRKLSAEVERDVGEAEFVLVLSDLFLHQEQDRLPPGRKRVDASLYHIVLRPEHLPAGEGPAAPPAVPPAVPGGGGFGTDGSPDADRPPLMLESDSGLVPVVDDLTEACIHCDAKTHHYDSHGEPLRDPSTGKNLRTEVLLRDGLRCRCCGSPYRLQVHHIHFRSKNGKTKAFNLLAICIDCHSLIHAGLLFIDGNDAADVVFVDRTGRPLHRRGERVDGKILVKLSAPLGAKGRSHEDLPGGIDPFQPPVTLESVPPGIDGVWWQRHADLIQARRGQGLRFRPGHPLTEEDVAGARAAEEAGAPASPAAFDGLVGQQALLHRLLAAADATRSRGRAYPHTLLVGPPGTGKTTLARGVAAALGGRLIATSGPLLQNGHDLLALLADLREGDVFFIDEVHAVPRPVLEILYQALADACVDLTFHAGSRARATRLELPRFTFLAATTEESQVPEALRSRFGFREMLGFYDEADLAVLLTRRAREHDVFFRAGAAEVLARAARGTPREALRLLDRVLDVFALRGDGVPDVAAVHTALATLGYDERGLDPRDQRYLALLQESDAPVPLTRIVALLGTDEGTVRTRIEPHLFRLGLVEMTPQGRQIAGRERPQRANGRASKVPDQRHVTGWPRRSRRRPRISRRRGGPGTADGPP